MMASEFRQLERLLQYPNEDLDKEYKNWLDLSDRDGQANLAKALIAIANHGGGYVIIGYSDENSILIPTEPRPPNLTQYSQDRINGIIQRYADPVFHCECRDVTHPENGLNYPIIIVPGGHKTPIHTRHGGPDGRYFNQNEYLIRRPGPRSEVPQSAQEWSELINRCIMNRKEDLLDGIRSILTGIPTQVIEEQTDVLLDEWVSDSLIRFDELVNERLPNEGPSRYSYGKWYIGYLINGDFDIPNLTRLREIIRTIVGNETGWPVWLYGVSHSMPYPYDGTIECLIISEHFSDGAHSDYWRASPEGKMFLSRGYQEDGSTSSHELGTVFDFTLPIWRIGECALHSYRLANELSDEPLEITLSVTWDGLQNRTLVSWASPRYFLRGNRCHTNMITSKYTFRSDQVETNLPEIVNEILKPLYEAFDFFTLPSSTLIHELRRLRGQA